MFTIKPTNVIKFGASQSGTFDTSQHHHGCNIGSNKLTFVQAYLCSDSLFNCTGDNNFCLYKIMFRKFTIKKKKLNNFARIGFNVKLIMNIHLI